MISVMTDSDWPNRYRLDIRGQEVWLNKQEAIQIIAYLSNVVCSSPVPEGKPVKMFQLFQKRAA